MDDRSQDDCQGAELADGLRREGERQESGRTAIVKYAGLGCWAWAAGIPCQDFETRSSTPVHVVHVPFVARFPWASPPTVAPGQHLPAAAQGVSILSNSGLAECGGGCATGGVRHAVRVREWVRIGWCCMKRGGCRPKIAGPASTSDLSRSKLALFARLPNLVCDSDGRH